VTNTRAYSSVVTNRLYRRVLIKIEHTSLLH
jgi:hypothetical protein